MGIPYVKGTGFQNPAVLRACEIRKLILYFGSVFVQGLQYDPGRSVSGLAVCHLSVFNVDDGGLQVLVQIMNDNFTGSSELFCNTMRHLL